MQVDLIGAEDRNSDGIYETVSIESKSLNPSDSIFGSLKLSVERDCLYYVRVTQQSDEDCDNDVEPDTDMVWSSPIWIDVQ